MFQRGRLDHFALSAPSEEAFREIRRRIESERAADGGIRDMKTMWIMGFHDPRRLLRRGDLAQARRAGRADAQASRMEVRRIELIGPEA